jgi:phosphoglycolate phosphatase
MSRSRPLRAAVFDLDGTLLDSVSLVLQAIAHALEPFGPRAEPAIFARLGGPPERFMRTLLDDVRHTPAAVARMAAYHQAHADRIAPFAGAIRLLETLHRDGIRLAVWTGRDRDTTEGLLREHHLGHLLSSVICGDDLPSHKPDPAGLRDIMRRLEVLPAETIYVGDADVDVLGGAACEVDTVLIRHRRDVPAAIVAQSWRTVPQPADAFKLLRECFA